MDVTETVESDESGAVYEAYLEETFDAWLQTELATPMSAQWIEEDLEPTPVVNVWIFEDDGTVTSSNFQWVIPDSDKGAKERWRVR